MALRARSAFVSAELPYRHLLSAVRATPPNWASALEKLGEDAGLWGELATQLSVSVEQGRHARGQTSWVDGDEALCAQREGLRIVDPGADTQSPVRPMGRAPKLQPLIRPRRRGPDEEDAGELGARARPGARPGRGGVQALEHRPQHPWVSFLREGLGEPGARIRPRRLCVGPYALEQTQPA